MLNTSGFVLILAGWLVKK